MGGERRARGHFLIVAALLHLGGAALPNGTTAHANGAPTCHSVPRDGIAGDDATAALPDGSVWYANRAGNRLMRIDASLNLTPFVPTDAASRGLSAIVATSDGAIWYAKDAANRIGRLPAGGGQGVEYELPEPRSFPVALTVDRSGAVWYAASNGNHIGRIDSVGRVTVHRPPKTSGLEFTPQHIALGADGNLWMTDRGHNAIYRFTIASSSFTRFDIATPRAHPARLRPGVDGNLWFTMTAARRIGRITPQGVITEFEPGDLAGGTPRDLVATPDGTIWFSGSGTRSGRIHPDGRIETFPCQGNLHTALLGPTQQPWFFGGNRLLIVETPGSAHSARPVASQPARAPAIDGTAATGPVVGAPWPVAAPPRPSPAADSAATPEPFVAMSLAAAIERLPNTPGRVVLQLTSNDPNCPFCVRHNPIVEQIAARRADEATYWRVSYEPWSTVGDDDNVRAAGIGGLPALIVFDDGREIGRLVGYDDAGNTERTLFPQGE